MASREDIEAICQKSDERIQAVFRRQRMILISVIAAWGVVILAAYLIINP